MTLEIEEIIMVTNIFSFSHNVFIRFVSLGVVKTMGFELEGYSKAGKTYSVLKSVSP